MLSVGMKTLNTNAMDLLMDQNCNAVNVKRNVFIKTIYEENNQTIQRRR